MDSGPTRTSRIGFWKFLPNPLGLGLPRALTRPGLGGFPTLTGRASLVPASSLYNVIITGIRDVLYALDPLHSEFDINN